MSARVQCPRSLGAVGWDIRRVGHAMGPEGGGGAGRVDSEPEVVQQLPWPFGEGAQQGGVEGVVDVGEGGGAWVGGEERVGDGGGHTAACPRRQ